MQRSDVKELDVEYNVDTNGTPYVTIYSSADLAVENEQDIVMMPLPQYEQFFAAIRQHNHFAPINLKREWEASQKEGV